MLKTIPNHTGVLIDIEDEQDALLSANAMRAQVEDLDPGHPFLVFYDDLIEKMEGELE